MPKLESINEHDIKDKSPKVSIILPALTVIPYAGLSIELTV
jgi:hypothetical protein